MPSKIDLGLLTLVCAIWAGNYFVVKGALQFSDPITFSFLRALLGGILIFALGGYAIRGLSRGDYLWMALVGLFSIAIFLVLLNVALTTVSPGIASTLVYTQPVFVVLLSPLIGEKLSSKKILGILAAFSGVGLVFWSSLSGFTPVIGDAYALAASLSWAVGIIIYKKSTKRYDSHIVTSIQLLAGSVFIVPAFAIGKPFLLASQAFFLYLGYNVVLATGFGYFLYYRILAKMPASQFSSYFFLVPILTQVFASALQLSAPTWNEVVGTMLVALGIVAVNR